jgi:hypothetical protein
MRTLVCIGASNVALRIVSNHIDSPEWYLLHHSVEYKVLGPDNVESKIECAVFTAFTVTFESLTVVLGWVKEGKIEHTPPVASLIPGAEVPIPEEDDCGFCEW